MYLRSHTTRATALLKKMYYAACISHLVCAVYKYCNLRTEKCVDMPRKTMASFIFLLILPCFVTAQLTEETLQFVEDYFTLKHVRIISCFTCSKHGTYVTTVMFVGFEVGADLMVTKFVMFWYQNPKVQNPIHQNPHLTRSWDSSFPLSNHTTYFRLLHRMLPTIFLISLASIRLLKYFHMITPSRPIYCLRIQPTYPIHRSRLNFTSGTNVITCTN